MIISDFKNFPRQGRVLGIDWGLRRVGVAVSDPMRNFVFVRDAIVLPRGALDHAERVAAVAKDEMCVGIVVGMPVYQDGSASDTTKTVCDFIQDLKSKTDLPIITVEENLTSFAAQENIGRARVGELKQKLDSEAARVILENAIAMLNRG